MPPSPHRRFVQAYPTVFLLLAAISAGAEVPVRPLPRAGAAAPRDASAGIDVIAQAMDAMYNLDFAGAHGVLDAQLKVDASDSLAHAARGVAQIFAEFERLHILDLEFFANDDSLTDKRRLTPDPAVRDRIFSSTTEARRLAGLALKQDPSDRRALFARMMAVGVETQYTGIVEKRYLRGGTLSKEAQDLAEKMLALSPPIYDAYVTLGSIEYTVGNLNAVYRFFARMRGLRSNKDEAAKHLQIVIAKGQYYRSYAKILLAVYYSREGQLKRARGLLDELREQFPNNALFPREIARIDGKVSAGGM
jgi:tetratricopeptide (TPR) repeat protein